MIQKIQKKIFVGWGSINKENGILLKPNNIDEIKFIVKNSEAKSIVPRGHGRSYGDSAQLKNKKVIDLSNFKKIIIDHKSKTIKAQAGLNFDEINNFIIPKGYFLPVTPGTRNITLGGAIASDVHGKNHFSKGSFGNFVKSIKLIDGNGEIQMLKNVQSNQKNRKKFWATVGGMGLTGVIIEATISLIDIDTSYIKIKTEKFKTFNKLLNSMKKEIYKSEYTVAWIDSTSSKGRGIIFSGNHLKKKYLEKQKLKKYSHLIYKKINSFNFPMCILKIFNINFLLFFLNKIYFFKHNFEKRISYKNLSDYFYPLDGITNWNKFYGKDGFYQYQFVLPNSAEDKILKILKFVQLNKSISYVTVLKKFGRTNLGYLSFPEEGWALSFDFPNNGKKTLVFLNELDKIVFKFGGKIYLTKDARMGSKFFKKSYKEYENWLKIKKEMDPHLKFYSSQAKRLNIN